MAQTEARVLTFDLTSNTGVGRGPAIGAPPAPARGVVVGFHADDDNSASVYWGMDSANYILDPNDAGALDIPPGFWVDLSTLAIDGKGTAGLVIHMVCVVVPVQP
jgi:hypothetical protein